MSENAFVMLCGVCLTVAATIIILAAITLGMKTERADYCDQFEVRKVYEACMKNPDYKKDTKQ